MNFNNFTIKSQEAVQEAVNLVQSRGQQAIEPVHIMQGVMKVGENVTNFIFQKLGMNGQQVCAGRSTRTIPPSSSTPSGASVGSCGRKHETSVTKAAHHRLVRAHDVCHRGAGARVPARRQRHGRHERPRGAPRAHGRAQRQPRQVQ